MREEPVRLATRPESTSEPASIAQVRAAVDGLCVPGVLGVAVQPIVRLADLRIVGYEALARMNSRPHEAPDWWLERAGEFGMRTRLEIACWRAITEYGPPPDDVLLFVNASPAVLAEPDLLALRDDLPEHLVIEVTEQEAVADYMQLRADLVPWLDARARLAIDDTGAGHSSLRHVIELSPDFLKIDRSLVASVDVDRNRRALLRSLVAFAREVGCSVIAEGVETPGELETLRDAEVDLVQGYLFGRPRLPWDREDVEETVRRRFGAAVDLSTAESPRVVREDDDRLRRRLRRAPDAAMACEAVVEYLACRGDMMPSVYLERQGMLRCMAQRGLWQVLDGMSSAAGITGRTWAAGSPMVVSDVSSSADYLEAIPGVVAEICVPILCEGRSIGALNVESLSPLPEATLAQVTECARLLSDRLAVVGWGASESAWQRAAHASVTISGLTLEHDGAEPILEAFTEASGIDSVGLIEMVEDDAVIRHATGPLAEVLKSVPELELRLLSALVDDVSSCYTGAQSTGRSFLGTESIRPLARAVVVLPLWSGGIRTGTVVLAHSRPLGLTSRDIEPLELLAGHLAATLSASSLVTQLRRQAMEDRLTGLGNRAALEELLDTKRPPRPSASVAVLLDLDHFKSVNDRLGHVVGDNALKAMALHLTEHLAGVEVFRYGGDEFALFLNDMSADHAHAVVRDLCETGQKVLAPYGSSITAGLAADADSPNLRDLFGRADKTLLWAKLHARGGATLLADAG